jgi:hypothetical protein
MSLGSSEADVIPVVPVLDDDAATSELPLLVVVVDAVDVVTDALGEMLELLCAPVLSRPAVDELPPV